MCESKGNPSPKIQWFVDDKLSSTSAVLLLNIDNTETKHCTCKSSVGNIVKKSSIIINVNCKLQ